MAYYDSEIPRPAPYGTSRPPRQAGRSCDEPEERRGRKAHNYAAYDTEFDEPDEPDEPYRRADGRPHSRSRRYFRARSRSQRRAHSPAPEGSLPHDPVRDTSAVAYTYEEDEPASIPIAPAPWNGHRSSITKEALIAFLVDQGCHPKRAAAQVDREFSAHAVQWVAGRADPFLSRSEHGVRDPPRSRRFEASREPGDGDGDGGEGERRGTKKERRRTERERERERDASPAYQPRRMPRAPSPPPASAYTRREHESQGQSQGQGQSSNSSRSRRQRDCSRPPRPPPPPPPPVSSYHDASPPPRPRYDYYESSFSSSSASSRPREPGAPRYQGASWYEPPRESVPRERGGQGWDRYRYEDMSREMDEMKRRMGEEKERRRY